jgi:hypothetical protein
VSVIHDFAQTEALNLAGNLTNSGNIYGISTSQAVRNAVFNASNIFNNAGGLLTTVLPAEGWPGLSGALASLNLSLNALNDIVNTGTISSAGNLSMTAGGSIVNQATVAAVNNVNLTSALGTIINSGTITASFGNLNIAAVTARNLAINNVGGTLSALNGSLNAVTASAAELGAKAGLSVTGGDLIARELKFISEEGLVSIAANTMEGRLNVSAGELHVSASTPNLILGEMNVTGDPTYWNAGGSITITAPLQFNIANLSLIASQDIVSAAGAGAIDVSSAGTNAGGILMIAGANFVTPATGSGSNDNSTVVTINGASATGGEIDLTGGGSNPITSLTTTSGNGDGGPVILVAFYGTSTPGTGSGTITLPTNVTITTGTTTNTPTALNGNVTIIAGAPSGDAIQIGGINATGNTVNPQTANNGMVTIASATPVFYGNPSGGSTGTLLQAGNTFTDTTLTVPDSSLFTVGQTIAVNPLGGNGEMVEVQGKPTSTTLEVSPLSYSHTVDDAVYTASSSLTIEPVGTVGSVASGLPMTSNGGIILPGTAQSGNITIAGDIQANSTIIISTNAAASAGNGEVELNGNMGLTMNLTTQGPPIVPYQAFPAINITGSTVTVASGTTINSQIATTSGGTTTTYANVPNTITITTQELVNDGTITGGAPSSSPFSNSYINIRSPGDLQLSGTGSFSVPGYSVIEVAAGDKNSLTLGAPGGSVPIFNTGTGSLVIFNGQSTGGSIAVLESQTVTVGGARIVSINTPLLQLNNGSQFNATSASVFAIGSGFTADDLKIDVMGSGNATIETAAGGAIRMRPTDGMNLQIVSSGGGTLTFTGAKARLATSGGGTTSIDSGVIPDKSSYGIVENPAGAIIGGAFQPYPGPYFASLDGEKPAFVAFSAYPFHVVLNMLGTIAAEQQFQAVATYTQQYSSSYVIGAAKQVGMRVSAGVFVDIGGDGTNIAPARTVFDYTWALSQASIHGNVMDIVVGNEDIVAGGPGDPDPTPSVNTLVATIQTVQTERGNYTNPVTGDPFTASELPVTTRQEIGVLTGDVTTYASMRSLLNTVDSYIYGNVYPFFSFNVNGGLFPVANQADFQNKVQANMTSQYGAAQTAFIDAKTATTNPVPNPPDIRVGETGWATELLSRTADPGYGYDGSGLAEQSTQFAEWYYPAMQDWSFKYDNQITMQKGVVIGGYFDLFNEPWKGIDGGVPGGASGSPESVQNTVGPSGTSIPVSTCCATTFPTLTPQSVVINPNNTTQEVQNIQSINGNTITLTELLNQHNAGEVIDAGTPEEPFFGIWAADGTFPNNGRSDSNSGYVFTLTANHFKYSYASGQGLPVYPNSQPQLHTLDLTDPATVAHIQQEQALGNFGGRLKVRGGVAVGGTLKLTPANLAGELSAKNIPARVSITFQNFTAADALNINITNTSTANQVILNGKITFKGSAPNPVISINTDQHPTVWVTGPRSSITSAGSLTITGNGNIEINGRVRTMNGFSLTSTAGTGPGNIAVNEAVTSTGPGDITINAAGNVTTRSISTGSKGLGNDVLIDAGGNFTLQELQTIRTHHGAIAIGANANIGGTVDLTGTSLRTSTAGTVEISADASITLGAIKVKNGSTSVTANSGQLMVDPHRQLLTREGDILLRNNGASAGDTIFIGEGARLRAIATAAGLGNLILEAGASGAQGGPNPNPAQTRIVLVGTGAVNFPNAGTMTINGPVNKLIAKNANITFSTAAGHGAGANAITLGGNNLLLADPPGASVAGGAATQLQRAAHAFPGVAPLSAGVVPALTPASGFSPDGLPMLVPAGTQAVLATSSAPGPAVLPITGPSPLPAGFGTVGPVDTMPSPKAETGLTNSSSIPARPLPEPASHLRCSSSASLTSHRSNHFPLESGEVLVASRERSFVLAGSYLIDVGPGAIVLVSRQDGVTSVRNLYETRHQVVRVLVDSRTIKLAAGHELIIGPDDGSVPAAMRSDRVGRRGLKTYSIDNRYGVAASEVSLVHLMQTSAVLTRLLRSSNAADRTIMNKVLKMAATIQHLRASRGAYAVSGGSVPESTAITTGDEGITGTKMAHSRP